MEAKRILKIAGDGDHPMSRFVRENMTLEQALKLNEFICYCEDTGIGLLNKEIN